MRLGRLPDDLSPSATDPTTSATLAAEVDRINDELWSIDVLVVEHGSDEEALMIARGFAVDGFPDEESEEIEESESTP